MFLCGLLKIDGQDDRLFERSSGGHDPVIPHQHEKLVSHGPGQLIPLPLRSDQILRFDKGIPPPKCIPFCPMIFNLPSNREERITE